LFEDGLRPVVDQGEHRPFDGGQDGIASVANGLPDRFAEVPGRKPDLVLDLLTQAVDELGEDEARIATGPEERGVGDRAERAAGGAKGPGLVRDGLHRRGQVRSRVRVGDRKDVDLVEDAPVPDDGLAARDERVIQTVAVEIADLHGEPRDAANGIRAP
jgi:hypothetical protein